MRNYGQYEGRIGRYLADSEPWWPTPPHPGDAAPNVVIILFDDLGFSHFGCFGSTIETPNIDALAANGLRFTNFHVTPVCSPTRAALLSGQWPARLHVTDWIAGHEVPDAKLKIPDWTKHLPLEVVTVAERLKDAGYATATIGKWHLGGEGFGPELHGFDTNHGGTARGQPPTYF